MINAQRLLMALVLIISSISHAMQEDATIPKKDTSGSGNSSVGVMTPATTISPGLKPHNPSFPETAFSDSDSDDTQVYETKKCLGARFCMGENITWNGYISIFSAIQIRDLPEQYHWLPIYLLGLKLEAEEGCQECIRILRSKLPNAQAIVQDPIAEFIRTYPNIHLSSYNVHQNLVDIFNKIRNQMLELDRGHRGSSFLKQYSQTPF